jgi:hypothetical protein
MDFTDWGVRLVLNNETRVWELTGKGPAHMLLHYLRDAEKSVIEKLQVEADFDDIVEETPNPDPNTSS